MTRHTSTGGDHRQPMPEAYRTHVHGPLLPMDEPSHWTDWLLRAAVAVTVAGIILLTSYH